MLEFKYDTQLLIEGENSTKINMNISMFEFNGDCLLAVGDEATGKNYFHTNEPWKGLELLFTAWRNLRHCY